MAIFVLLAEAQRQTKARDGKIAPARTGASMRGQAAVTLRCSMRKGFFNPMAHVVWRELSQGPSGWTGGVESQDERAANIRDDSDDHDMTTQGTDFGAKWTTGTAQTRRSAGG